MHVLHASAGPAVLPRLRRAAFVSVLLATGCAGPRPVRPLAAPSSGPRPAVVSAVDPCQMPAQGRLAPGTWRETVAFQPTTRPRPTWVARRPLVVGPGQRATVAVESDGFGRPGLALVWSAGAVRGTTAVAADAGPGAVSLDAPPGVWTLSLTGAEGREASLGVTLAGPSVAWAAVCGQRSQATPERLGLSDAVRRALFPGRPSTDGRTPGWDLTARSEVTAYDIETDGSGTLLVAASAAAGFGDVQMVENHEAALIGPDGRAWPLGRSVAAAAGASWSVVVAGGHSVTAYGARALRPAPAVAVLARLDTAAVLAAPVSWRWADG